MGVVNTYSFIRVADEWDDGGLLISGIESLEKAPHIGLRVCDGQLWVD